ncbi:MAG: RhuM family protein [Clostridium sp.]
MSRLRRNFSAEFKTEFYSLAAIIAVGYRINSERATQFRTWATKVLDTFTKQGYVLDKSRLINGQIFDEDFLSILLLRFRKSEQVREEFLFATKGGKYGILYIKALSRNEKGKSKYETRTR